MKKTFASEELFLFSLQIPKLRYFILKSAIFDDCQSMYLKWILNNVNYTKKIKLHLQINVTCE